MVRLTRRLLLRANHTELNLGQVLVIFATPAARTMQFLRRLRRANDALDKVSGLHLPIFSCALCNRTSLSDTCHGRR